MSKIQKITDSQKRPFLTPKNTGYAAAGALFLASTRGFSKGKSVPRFHKFIGYMSGLLTLLHIGVVEYLHFKYKKM